MPSVICSSCPICQSSSLSEQIKVKDYTVSKEMFEIWECNRCKLRFTQNIPSAEEIGAYYQSENYISHTDTSKGFINRLYHLVRKQTLQKKSRLLQNKTGLLKGKLLDIGAGTGAFVHTMQEAGWDITGLEPDSASRNRAKQLYQVNLEPIDKLFKLEPNQFDAITLWHVLEHVHDLHAYIQQLHLLLKPEGCIFIAVPNYSSYDAKVYNEYWAAYDVPRHLYHFHPSSIKQLTKQHLLQVKEILPMWFDSFYIAMLSEQYKKGKSGLINAVFNGLLSNMKTISDKERCSSLIYIVTKQSLAE